eukprot:scaffold421369_cov98-Attheya_sp.AAC.1
MADMLHQYCWRNHRWSNEQMFVRSKFVGMVPRANVALTFQLVTRFPWRVLELSETNRRTTLADAGIAAGQEVFMMEKIE